MFNSGFMQRLFQQQRLQQKLSPQQIQFIRMIEDNNMEIDERIKAETFENPALEIINNEPAETTHVQTQDNSKEDYSSQFDEENYMSFYNNDAGQSKNDRIQADETKTLHSYLMEQLNLTELDKTDRKIIEYIAGNIEDDGYLRRPLQRISDDLLIQFGIDKNETELKNLLDVIQKLDPAGVGAMNLKECILLQLKRMKQTPTVRNAILIIENYYDDFANKNYEYIIKKENIGEEVIKEAMNEIKKVNPRPGNIFAASSMELSSQQVSPDFLLENKDGELLLSLNNSYTPELRVRRDYINMVKELDSPEAKKNLKKEDAEKLKHSLQIAKSSIAAATWFVDAVKQRQNTLLSTMQAIIDFQYEYFMDGDENKLKPMVLKDIANTTGYDISTISRVCNSKYIETDFGIFSLKTFFSEGSKNKAGEDVTIKEIKNVLQNIIEKEDKRKPFTDDKLVGLLSAHGYKIARRTVAKYREQLNIPNAKMRREI